MPRELSLSRRVVSEMVLKGCTTAKQDEDGKETFSCQRRSLVIFSRDVLVLRVESGADRQHKSRRSLNRHGSELLMDDLSLTVKEDK